MIKSSSSLMGYGAKSGGSALPPASSKPSNATWSKGTAPGGKVGGPKS